MKIMPRDILTQCFRIAFEQVAKCDICGPDDEDFPEIRGSAHARLRELRTQAATHGLADAELYDDIISREEAHADFEAESGEDVQWD